jgi:FkbM family methyltransferase
MRDDPSWTWRRRVVNQVNRLIRRSGMRLVRASSAEEYLMQGFQEVSCGDVTFRCDPHHSPFWTNFGGQQWETETLSILRRYLNPQSVYYDIGSWIGPTVLYASQHSGTVLAFEPDPVAYRFLLENVTNNGLTNVRTFNLAVAATDGVASIRSFGKELGDSMGSLLPGASGSSRWPVTTVSIDTLLNSLSCPAPTFLKIDIEGSEFELVPTLRPYLERWRPVLYLSIHAPFLPIEERESKLQALARSLDLYPYAIDRYEEWSRGSCGPFALAGLPAAQFRDDFGSLLLLPEPPR